MTGKWQELLPLSKTDCAFASYKGDSMITASLLILCNRTMLIINSKCIILNLASSLSPFHPNTLLYLLFRARVTPDISFWLSPASSSLACQDSYSSSHIDRPLPTALAITCRPLSPDSTSSRSYQSLPPPTRPFNLPPSYLLRCSLHK